MRFKSILVVLLIFTLFTTGFSSVAGAKGISKKEAKQIELLADQLEFIFEDAAIKDNNGEIISFDIEMIEQKFGTSPELEELKVQIKKSEELKQKEIMFETSSKDTMMPMMPMMMAASSDSSAVDRCIEAKIKASYKEILSVGAFGTFYSYLWAGEYKLAASKLIKIGVKGSVYGIATELAYYFLTCEYKVNGW
jgi:hypothetical protein